MEEGACHTVLVIDDDAHTRALFQATLEEAGYRVLVAGGGLEGVELFQAQAVDLVVVDIFMPEMDGLELIRRLRASHAACKIMAMSGGVGEWDYLEVAKRLGANQTLRKPCSSRELLEAVRGQLIAAQKE
ncbi:MAG: response regulator [Nitrospira sp.]|nr:response regulator [Nitrospira sp.]